MAEPLWKMVCCALTTAHNSAPRPSPRENETHPLSGEIPWSRCIWLEFWHEGTKVFNYLLFKVSDSYLSSSWRNIRAFAKSSLERTCQTRRFHGWQSLRQMFLQTIPERRFWRREIGLLKMISAWQYKEASVKPPAFSPLEAELPTAESLKFILGWPFSLKLTRPKQNANSSHKNPTCQCLGMLLINARIWKQLKHLWIGEWVNKSMCVLSKNKWLRMSIDTHNMDLKCTSLRGGHEWIQRLLTSRLPHSKRPAQTCLYI